MSPAVAGGGEAGVIMKLPSQIGLLIGSHAEPTDVEKANLPEDTEFCKMTYHTSTDRDDERDIAHVSVVLAGSERRSIHRPEVCLKGQGWTVVGSDVVDIPLVAGRSLAVTDLAIERWATQGGKSIKVRGHYVYWFVGSDVTTPSHAERIFRTTVDSVVHNINHRWAYASVMAIVTEDMEPSFSHERRRTDAETRRLISYLIENLVPQFQRSYMSPSLTSANAHP